MQTDTTLDSSGTEESERRKSKFFNCWKKNRKTEQKKENISTPSLKYDKLPVTFKDQNTSTEPKEKEENVLEEKSTDTEGQKRSDIKKSGRKETRCRKCFKKKREKDSNRQRIDKRYCRCRAGGYCNTNTIVFPSDYKSNSSDFKEMQYLHLIEGVIKEETRKNISDMCEIKREIDRQREEIKELKTLLLQNLTDKTTNKDKDKSFQQNDSGRRTPGEPTRRTPGESARRTPADTTRYQTKDPAQRKKQAVGKSRLNDRDHSLIPVTSSGLITRRSSTDLTELKRSVSTQALKLDNKDDNKDRNKGVKPNVWTRLFGNSK